MHSYVRVMFFGVWVMPLLTVPGITGNIVYASCFYFCTVCLVSSPAAYSEDACVLLGRSFCGSRHDSTINLTSIFLLQAGGLLKDWEAGTHLAKLQQSMLILRGSNEELLLESAQQLHSLRPGGTCSIETLEGAASYAHIDAWEPYLEAVNSFMISNDQPAA